ncbi:MAG: dimethylsulfonioproprionate lyase family protein [Rhizobiaceae bacterium]
MNKQLFDHAFEEIRLAYESHPEMAKFCEFPTDIEWREMPPFLIPPARLMAEDSSLETTEFESLRDALVAVGDDAHWRETYRGTNIGEDFLSRFGCYELFGWEGHYQCQSTRGFLVYSTGGLYYPWHHHPAEEIYLIIAGEAEFATEGNRPRMLKPGDTVFHAENQPHNMTTRDKGVLAWVQWRGDMSVAPVLTDRLNG